jgi:hypothetical protein
LEMSSIPSYPMGAADKTTLWRRNIPFLITQRKATCRRPQKESKCVEFPNSRLLEYSTALCPHVHFFPGGAGGNTFLHLINKSYSSCPCLYMSVCMSMSASLSVSVALSVRMSMSLSIFVVMSMFMSLLIFKYRYMFISLSSL